MNLLKRIKMHVELFKDLKVDDREGLLNNFKGNLHLSHCTSQCEQIE